MRGAPLQAAGPAGFLGRSNPTVRMNAAHADQWSSVSSLANFLTGHDRRGGASRCLLEQRKAAKTEGRGESSSIVARQLNLRAAGDTGVAAGRRTTRNPREVFSSAFCLHCLSIFNQAGAAAGATGHADASIDAEVKTVHAERRRRVGARLGRGMSARIASPVFAGGMGKQESTQMNSDKRGWTVMAGAGGAAGAKSPGTGLAEARHNVPDRSATHASLVAGTGAVQQQSCCAAAFRKMTYATRNPELRGTRRGAAASSERARFATCLPPPRPITVHRSLSLFVRVESFFQQSELHGPATAQRVDALSPPMSRRSSERPAAATGVFLTVISYSY